MKSSLIVMLQTIHAREERKASQVKQMLLSNGCSRWVCHRIYIRHESHTEETIKFVENLKEAPPASLDWWCFVFFCKHAAIPRPNAPQCLRVSVGPAVFPDYRFLPSAVPGGTIDLILRSECHGSRHDEAAICLGKA